MPILSQDLNIGFFSSNAIHALVLTPNETLIGCCNPTKNKNKQLVTAPIFISQNLVPVPNMSKTIKNLLSWIIRHNNDSSGFFTQMQLLFTKIDGEETLITLLFSGGCFLDSCGLFPMFLHSSREDASRQVHLPYKIF